MALSILCWCAQASLLDMYHQPNSAMHKHGQLVLLMQGSNSRDGAEQHAAKQKDKVSTPLCCSVSQDCHAAAAGLTGYVLLCTSDRLHHPALGRQALIRLVPCRPCSSDMGTAGFVEVQRPMPATVLRGCRSPGWGAVRRCTELQAADSWEVLTVQYMCGAQRCAICRCVCVQVVCSGGVAAALCKRFCSVSKCCCRPVAYSLPITWGDLRMMMVHPGFACGVLQMCNTGECSWYLIGSWHLI